MPAMSVESMAFLAPGPKAAERAQPPARFGPPRGRGGDRGVGGHRAQLAGPPNRGAPTNRKGGPIRVPRWWGGASCLSFFLLPLLLPAAAPSPPLIHRCSRSASLLLLLIWCCCWEGRGVLAQTDNSARDKRAGRGTTCFESGRVDPTAGPRRVFLAQQPPRRGGPAGAVGTRRADSKVLRQEERRGVSISFLLATAL